MKKSQSFAVFKTCLNMQSHFGRPSMLLFIIDEHLLATLMVRARSGCSRMMAFNVSATLYGEEASPTGEGNDGLLVCEMTTCIADG